MHKRLLHGYDRLIKLALFFKLLQLVYCKAAVQIKRPGACAQQEGHVGRNPHAPAYVVAERAHICALGADDLYEISVVAGL